MDYSELERSKYWAGNILLSEEEICMNNIGRILEGTNIFNGLNGLRGDYGKSMRDFIEENLSPSGTVSSGFGSGFNLYPCDTYGPTYPEWLGIHKQKSSFHSLDRVLDNGRRWIRDARQAFRNQKKTMVILTDKWNCKFQQEIEKALYCEYVMGDLNVIILLYNDYGITYIPFLLSDSSYINHIMNDPKFVQNFCKSAQYIKTETSSWPPGLETNITITFSNTLSRYIDNENNEGSIRGKATNDFIMEIIPILREIVQNSQTVQGFDTGTERIIIGGTVYDIDILSRQSCQTLNDMIKRHFAIL